MRGFTEVFPFSLLRGETWQSCYVVKEVWCSPWRSSSCTGSNQTVFSRGTCLFGTLWVSTDVCFLSPSGGGEYESRISNCTQQSMIDLFFTPVFVFYNYTLPCCPYINKWWADSMTVSFSQRRQWFPWRQQIRWVTCMDQLWQRVPPVTHCADTSTPSTPRRETLEKRESSSCLSAWELGEHHF